MRNWLDRGGVRGRCVTGWTSVWGVIDPICINWIRLRSSVRFPQRCSSLFTSHSLNPVACGGGVCGRLGQITPSALNIFENLGYCHFSCSLSAASCLMRNFQVKIWDISIMPKTWCIFHEKQGKFSERKDSTSIYFQILKYFIEEEG